MHAIVYAWKYVSWIAPGQLYSQRAPSVNAMEERLCQQLALVFDICFLALKAGSSYEDAVERCILYREGNAMTFFAGAYLSVGTLCLQFLKHLDHNKIGCQAQKQDSVTLLCARDM